MIVDLARVPKSAAYLVINRISRNFYINYTQDMGGALARLYFMIGEGRFGDQEEVAGYQLCVLVESSDAPSLKLHSQYWRDRLVGEGYSEVVPQKRRFIQYVGVRVVPSEGLKFVDVELVTSRGDALVVGRFKGRPEARDFIESCYGADNSDRFPVYAFNSLTRELIGDKQGPMGLEVNLY